MTDRLTTILGLGLIAWLTYKTTAKYNLDPGLVGVQKNTTDLQIPGETIPDMENYTEVSAFKRR